MSIEIKGNVEMSQSQLKVIMTLWPFWHIQLDKISIGLLGVPCHETSTWITHESYDMPHLLEWNQSISFFYNSHSISLGLWFASCLLSPATINHNSKFKNSIINPRIDAYDTMIRYYHIIHCICKFHSIGQNPRILLTDFFLLFFCV